MSSILPSALNLNTTDKYFIEYDGFLTNHLSHGIIALHRLGATSERIERFVKWYTPKLIDQNGDKVDSRDVDALRGKRVAFYKIFSHYEALLKNKYKTIDCMLAEEFPKITRGLAGSALHGAIHLGYGYSARSERIVLEGLTYIYHSYTPIVTENASSKILGDGNVEIIEALGVVGNDSDLRQSMMDNLQKEEWSKERLCVGLFQRRVAYLLTCQGDKLINYALAVKIPEDARDKAGVIDALKLAREVVHWAVTAYALSDQKNDFFLLHGVTAAWSMLQIMPLLSNDDGLKVIQEFITVLIAVYVAQNSPKFNVPASPDVLSTDGWNDLMAKTIANDIDGHCYKLVQVCHDMVVDNMLDGAIYVQAARSALSNPFVYTLDKQTVGIQPSFD